VANKPFKLDKDDPEKRAAALKHLIRVGADDLIEMIGVKTPIPFYGEKV
jgi:hypothetical protein